nr:ABC transporter ATP-binding protein [Rhizobiaceae bacterium]
MFAWFENRINPFPDTAPTQPPGKLLAFAIHYTRGVWPWLIVTSVLIAIISALQVALFGFMGSIVDWLAAADRATFWQNEGWKLAAMGAVVLVVLPILGALHTLFMHQTIVGNYPMRIRWQAHRYLLGQSYAFYQDEFAGRVATKMMQTALGIRESVMKIVDVFVYVIVYFAGAMVLAASFDLLLMLPFAIWLVCYIGLLRHYLPRLRDVSEAQSDARSTMTGRVVDSYTNILTVKLFAHAGREESYARDSMRDFLGTVHPQMRMVSQLNIWLDLVNSALLFAVAAIGIWLWQVEASTVGAVAVGVGLVLRLEGMAHWVMWELAGVFENLGMAVDGMGMLSKPRTVTDKPAATELAVSRGGIRFEHIRFHYGKEGGVIDNLTLDI